MITRKRIIMLSSMLVLGMVIGGIVFMQMRVKTENAPEAISSFEFDSSYEELSRDEMIAQADAIFVGEVVSISPARWNQDSGMFWRRNGFTSVAFHEIEVKVLQSLYDRVRLGKQAKITVLGASPAGTIEGSDVQVTGRPEHTLQSGTQAVFFIVKREIVWQGGAEGQQPTRPIFRLVGAPEVSYLTLQSDGLFYSADSNEAPVTREALLARVKQR